MVITINISHLSGARERATPPATGFRRTVNKYRKHGHKLCHHCSQIKCQGTIKDIPHPTAHTMSRGMGVEAGRAESMCIERHEYYRYCSQIIGIARFMFISTVSDLYVSTLQLYYATHLFLH